MVAKLKVDQLETVDGTGNITVNNQLTAPSFAGDGSSLTALDATALTGNLPAIDGSSLTGVGGDLSFGGDTFGADKTIGSNDNYALSFETDGTERLRLLSSGGITFNGDTATANALDDYEEGDWTPIISGSSPPGVGTYQSTWGKYTKVGNVVTINFNLRSKTHTGSGGSYLGGLPFTSKNCSGNWDIPIGGELLSCGSGKVLKGHLHKNAVIARVMKIDYNGGESYMINIENNDMILSGSFSYLAE